MKKFFSIMVLAATLMVSSVANASLITFSIGGDDWDVNDSTLNIYDPIQKVIADGLFENDIFNGSIANVCLGATGQPVEVSGGTYSISECYRYGSADGDGLMDFSFNLDYVTQLFDMNSFVANITGSMMFEQVSYDLFGTMTGFNNTNENNAAWTWTLQTMQNNNPGDPGVSVPEPTTIAIFSLGIVLMLRRSQSSSLI
jgi:hypothetical protein